MLILYDHRYTATYRNCVRRYEHQPEACEAPRRTLAADEVDGHHLALATAIQDAVGAGTGPGDDQPSYAERLDLLHRQLFVAVTWARDALWLGWVAEPSSILPAGTAQG